MVMTGSNVKFSQDGVIFNDQIHNKFTCQQFVSKLGYLIAPFCCHHKTWAKSSEVLTHLKTPFGL